VKASRAALLLAGLCVLLGAEPATAQTPTKVATIGVLELAPLNSAPRALAALRKGLAEHGWVEEQTFRIVVRSAEGKAEHLPSAAAELVALKVDVIVTTGTTSIRAARDATSTIPIVSAATADPVAMGFATSLARPGGNITGLSILSGDIGSKRLELLKQTVPRATTVAVLLHGANPGNPTFLKALQEAAPRLKLRLHPVAAREPAEFEATFDSITRAGANALWVIEDPVFGAHAAQLVQLAAKHRLPAMWGNRLFVEAGGLMTYGLVYEDLWRRSGAYVDRILRGAKPGDLPIEQPNKFDLVINMKTAKALGLTIPQSILARADQLIE
jgi:putative ABC transport system substrate-binding protein